MKLTDDELEQVNGGWKYWLERVKGGTDVDEWNEAQRRKQAVVAAYEAKFLKRFS